MTVRSDSVSKLRFFKYASKSKSSPSVDEAVGAEVAAGGGNEGEGTGAF